MPHVYQPLGKSEKMKKSYFQEPLKRSEACEALLLGLSPSEPSAPPPLLLDRPSNHI